MRTLALTLLTLLVAASVGFAVSKWRPIEDSFERPPSHDEIGVRLAELTFELSVIEDASGHGFVTQLLPQGFGSDGCPLVVSETGAIWLERGECPSRSLRFARPGVNVRAIDWDGDSEPEFLARGQWARGPWLQDSAGVELWRHSPAADALGVNDTAQLPRESGGFDLVMGFNGGGGVSRLDASGRALWHHEDANVWRVAVIDVDADGRPEVVHSNARGEVTVRRSEDGVVLSRGRPAEGYVGQFDVLTWEGEPTLVSLREGAVQLLSAQAALRLRLENPLVPLVSNPSAAVLAGTEGRPEHIVAVLSIGPWDRSLVSVHDRTGRLRYSELREGRCEAVAELPATPDGPRFWVGCGDRVLEYRVPGATTSWIR